MKEKVPGVGASIGLDRLIAGLTQLGITSQKGSYLDAEIFCQDEELTIHYQKLAAQLRAKGVAVEVFPDTRKMNQQYKVTEAKGIPWGIFVKKEQTGNNRLTLKKLLTREMSENISVDEAVRKILG
jgi:histidyl-tRNA synthetase